LRDRHGIAVPACTISDVRRQLFLRYGYGLRAPSNRRSRFKPIWAGGAKHIYYCKLLRGHLLFERTRAEEALLHSSGRSFRHVNRVTRWGNDTSPIAHVKSPTDHGGYTKANASDMWLAADQMTDEVRDAFTIVSSRQASKPARSLANPRLHSKECPLARRPLRSSEAIREGLALPMANCDQKPASRLQDATSGRLAAR